MALPKVKRSRVERGRVPSMPMSQGDWLHTFPPVEKREEGLVETLRGPFAFEGEGIGG